MNPDRILPVILLSAVGAYRVCDVLLSADKLRPGTYLSLFMGVTCGLTLLGWKLCRKPKR